MEAAAGRSRAGRRAALSYAPPACGDVAEQMTHLLGHILRGAQREYGDVEFVLPREDSLEAFVGGGAQTLAHFLLVEAQLNLQHGVRDDKLSTCERLHGERIVGEAADDVVRT